MRSKVKVIMLIFIAISLFLVVNYFKENRDENYSGVILVCDSNQFYKKVIRIKDEYISYEAEEIQEVPEVFQFNSRSIGIHNGDYWIDWLRDRSGLLIGGELTLNYNGQQVVRNLPIGDIRGRVLLYDGENENILIAQNDLAANMQRDFSALRRTRSWLTALDTEGNVVFETETRERESFFVEAFIQDGNYVAIAEGDGEIVKIVYTSEGERVSRKVLHSTNNAITYIGIINDEVFFFESNYEALGRGRSRINGLTITRVPGQVYLKSVDLSGRIMIAENLNSILGTSLIDHHRAFYSTEDKIVMFGSYGEESWEGESWTVIVYDVENQTISKTREISGIRQRAMQNLAIFSEYNVLYVHLRDEESFLDHSFLRIVLDI